ncbi:flagellar basal body P-ring formation chaperone FlgA [Palleronia sp. LCG004]|uniref:flagellar basal body P-ring formation chaperone FlgA n=1 Tax=Palleronia sp. LCG004 TaxID=3079304 RepID=UPI0029439E4D|nr:flagellar basal body P-ring formation chaperone FlgA [Palleronia sp. LCG004]WOI56189.1 flagellar basal body P-ring formation chaperone FlgA [Palleronia sp. LCG004]
MIRTILLCLVAAGPASADMIVAAQTIRAKTIIEPEHLSTAPGDAAGAIEDADALLGQEARVTLYAGRPIRSGDVGPPAIIERNEIVTMNFSSAGITISTEARALDRAGVGDRIRAMNLTSRNTVFGTVTEDGSIFVDGVMK